jgi:hypothetical protein
VILAFYPADWSPPDFTPFTADASGITAYPFTPLPASPVPVPSLP